MFGDAQRISRPDDELNIINKSACLIETKYKSFLSTTQVSCIKLKLLYFLYFLVSCAILKHNKL